MTHNKKQSQIHSKRRRPTSRNLHSIRHRRWKSHHEQNHHQLMTKILFAFTLLGIMPLCFTCGQPDMPAAPRPTRIVVKEVIVTHLLEVRRNGGEWDEDSLPDVYATVSVDNGIIRVLTDTIVDFRVGMDSLTIIEEVVLTPENNLLRIEFIDYDLPNNYPPGFQGDDKMVDVHIFPWTESGADLFSGDRKTFTHPECEVTLVVEREF